MKQSHVERLRVRIGENTVGRIAITAQGRILFEYDAQWLSHGFDIAPYTVRFGPGPQAPASDVLSGLHGCFYDSLPDGWGLLLMDRAFREAFSWSPVESTALDRLAYIGARGMGALIYEPEIDLAASGLTAGKLDLGSLAAAADLFLEGSASDVLKELYLHGGSPGGARPKVAVGRHPGDGRCISGFDALPDGFEHWLVKFRGIGDGLSTGRAEYAYAQMAREAGLDMPPTALIEVQVPVAGRKKRTEHYFGVRRFDREGNRRIHVLSLCGHLYASHRLPSMDYSGVLATTSRLTSSAAETAKAFRLMVFNAVTHNRDDHTKNFAYLRTDSGWRLSPPFDLTYSAGPANHHATAIGGGVDPTQADILKVAAENNVRNAKTIVEEVVTAVGQWKSLASTWEVPKVEAAAITNEIERLRSLVGSPAPKRTLRPR
ncbi:MAG TPA: type II toxin-antitoxin system HipA family toxin [Burkholderiaceae bacterium]|nr:type II toxin-antitoxin system HipA family toxin [Burkholderiaceae bacterium]